MTIGLNRAGAMPSLLDDDEVLHIVRAWRQQGLRTALVTLVGVEGGAPRQPGAQMAVAEDGRFVGYLSGGCLEQAVALEAQDVIAKGANRLLRYGKGSPYFDIRLPCGSGLDLYFDQAIDDAQIDTLQALRSSRRAAVLQTRLSDGASTVEPVIGETTVSARDGDVFRRVYPAPLQLALIGNGPALTGIATLAAIAGIELMVWSTDQPTREQLTLAGVQAKSSEDELGALIQSVDETSAAVVVFHDHDAEPAILKALLTTPAFYIGVLGNRAVHRARCAALAAMGVAPAEIERLHAPVGVIPNAKSKTTFAFGVLAELLAVAKARNLVA